MLYVYNIYWGSNEVADLYIYREVASLLYYNICVLMQCMTCGILALYYYIQGVLYYYLQYIHNDDNDITNNIIINNDNSIYITCASLLYYNICGNATHDTIMFHDMIYYNMI